MKVSVNECYELDGDYQNQFLGDEVFPQPKYKKVKLSERTVNKVHYNDVYILEPLHYYYVTFDVDILKLKEDDEMHYMKTSEHFAINALLMHLDAQNNRMFLFNASQNIIYVQKGTVIGEVVL